MGFDNSEDPSFAQIYGKSGRTLLRHTSLPEYALNFSMKLLRNEHSDYPGSVIWRRESRTFGENPGGSANYFVVQVMNQYGEKIYPAWSAFEAYQRSSVSGMEPGKLFYYGPRK